MILCVNGPILAHFRQNSGGHFYGFRTSKKRDVSPLVCGISQGPFNDGEAPSVGNLLPIYTSAAETHQVAKSIDRNIHRKNQSILIIHPPQKPTMWRKALSAIAAKPNMWRKASTAISTTKTHPPQKPIDINYTPPPAKTHDVTKSVGRNITPKLPNVEHH